MIAVTMMLATLVTQTADSSVGGLTVDLYASADTVDRDHPVAFTVRLRNTTDSAITLTFGSTCQLLLYITDSAGTVVIPPVYSCGQSETHLYLEPRQPAFESYEWAGGDWLSSGDPAPNGTYFAVGQVDIGRGILTSRRIRIVLRSP